MRGSDYPKFKDKSLIQLGDDADDYLVAMESALESMPEYTYIGEFLNSHYRECTRASVIGLRLNFGPDYLDQLYATDRVSGQYLGQYGNRWHNGMVTPSPETKAVKLLDYVSSMSVFVSRFGRQTGSDVDEIVSWVDGTAELTQAVRDYVAFSDTLTDFDMCMTEDPVPGCCPRHDSVAVKNKLESQLVEYAKDWSSHRGYSGASIYVDSEARGRAWYPGLMGDGEIHWVNKWVELATLMERPISLAGVLTHYMSPRKYRDIVDRVKHGAKVLYGREC